jgi:hypothetical protein
MNEKLEFLTKELVQQAADKIDEQGISARREAKGYEVFINNNHYPFKLLVSEAAKIANIELSSNDFGSSEYTRDFFAKQTGYTCQEISPESSDIDLAAELEKRFKNIWRCADSNKWHILKETDLLTFDWLDKNTNYKEIDINQLPRGKRAIKPWVNSLKEGDLIFIMGKNNFQGIAVCKSEYDYNGPFVNMGESGEKPAIKIEYIYKSDEAINHNIKTHNNPTTFAKINQYNFNLRDTVSFLKEQVPEAYTKLAELVQMESNMNVIERKMIKDINKMPLNQIFFGPPGTGKTYFLLENIIPDFKQKSIPKPFEIIESEIISELPWWKIFALVLLDDGNQTVPQIKEHRFVKYKLSVSNTKSLNQTVWGQLSSHTIKESKTVEYGSRIGSLIFDKEEDSIWYIAKDNDPAINELQELMNELKVAENSSNKEINNFKFITFHQSTAYETFVEGIMPVLSEETKDETTEVQYEVRKGTFYKACDQAAKLAGFLGLKDCIEHSKEERMEKFKTAKPYALLIDEINRGNISSILGELITLIEEDKRLTKNEIIVELPYSGNPFAVPPNLHIIGTMNTADRSVEALDTALRRRFSFTEMPPHYNLSGLDYEFAGVKGSVILEKINKRIEKLLDRDHLIGHSYFLLNEEEKLNPEPKLLDSFYCNIIPLLQEYFFGDYAKIGAVLGGGLVYAENQNDQTDFATGYENEEFAEKDIYQIIDYRPNETGNKYIQPNMTFEKAIRLLLNQTLKTESEA